MTWRLRILSALFLGVCFHAKAQTTDESQVIFPKGTPGAEVSTPKSGAGFGAVSVLGVALLAGAGGWMLWRNRKVSVGGREQRLLAIDETRPLGNRQYLVVASCEGKKLLLGVCPGRIDLLTHLSGGGEKSENR